MKSLLQRATSLVFRSRLFARFAFNLDLGPLKNEDHYCDSVTLVLLQRVCKDLTPDTRVLDMGTGAVAVISLVLWKRIGCKITAVDINPEIAALARESIRRQGASIPVICSRFFEKVDQPFDIVIFDPPYVSTQEGLEANLPANRRSQWDGGHDGAKVIENFVDAFKGLNKNVKVYMGVNHWHVAREKVLKLLNDSTGICLHEVYRHPLLPVDVYVFTKGVI